MIKVIGDKRKYGRKISLLDVGNTFILDGAIYLCVRELYNGVVECYCFTESCIEEFTDGQLDWVVQLIDCEMIIKDIE